MIFHLHSGGVAIAWRLLAIYGDAYGIALNSAESWHGKRDERSIDSHFIVELDHRSGTFGVQRCDLVMAPEAIAAIEPEDRLHVQFNSLFPVDERAQSIVREALKAKLVKVGFAVPREEWARRRPGQALLSKRWAEFRAAQDEAGQVMRFDIRWTPFMHAPEGFVHPFKVEELDFGLSRLVKLNDLSGVDIADVPPGLTDKISALCRILNAGWSLDEAQILLADKPMTPGAGLAVAPDPAN